MELARKLGIETVAEGIEAPEQVDFLRSIGCDLVQGYVYARPMPAEELEAWKRSGKRIARLRAAEREMQTKEDSVRLETPAGKRLL